MAVIPASPTIRPMAGRRVMAVLITLGVALMTVPFTAVAIAGPAPATGIRGQAEPSESPSPGPIIPLPSPSSASPSPSRSEPPSSSPTPTRRRRSASPNPVVTVIPAPTTVQSVAPPPSTKQQPPAPIDVGNDTASPDSATTKKAAKAPPKQPTDPLTRLVQFLLAAAILLGVGGGVGLYLTRDTR